VRNLHKTISLLLALSLLQFFVPLLHVAMELPCCDEQSGNSETMPCCQAEFPSRAVCCYGEPRHVLDDSAPAQATLEKTSQVHVDLAVLDQPCTISPCLMPSSQEDFYCLSHRPADNKRYKLLATFLI
jgi:hypothetical protein